MGGDGNTEIASLVSGYSGGGKTLPSAAKALQTAALASCAAAGIAGCATTTVSSQPSPHPDPASPARSSAVQTRDPQTLARQAYLGMWRAYVSASRTADYQAASLDHYAAGAALSVLTHGLYQNHQQGVVTRGQPMFDPSVTMVGAPSEDATQADVTDCADSSGWLDYRSGKPITGQPQGRRKIIARLQLFDGVWKVTYLNVGKAGTC